MSHLAMTISGRNGNGNGNSRSSFVPTTGPTSSSSNPTHGRAAFASRVAHDATKVGGTAAAATAMPQWKLNPAAVRERAKSIPGCQEVSSQGETVLSFMVGLPSDASSPNPSTGSQGNSNSNSRTDKSATDALARINVFVESGTVGTSRVLDGKVRQTFRRNVTSLDVIERLLRYPEGPVEINEALIGFSDEDRTNRKKDGGAASGGSVGGGTGGISTSSHNREAVLSSPRSVKKELELADVGLCILQGEREKLEKHLAHLESLIDARGGAGDVGGGGKTNVPHNVGAGPKAKNGVSNSNSLPRKDTNQKSKPLADTEPKKQQRHPKRGKNSRVHQNDDDEEDDDEYETGSSSSSSHGAQFYFKLPTDVMKQVDQCLRDISKMDKIVKGVATNGKGTVFLYGNGGVAYTPSIPKALYQKLRVLRSSSFASRPCFVSLGTRDRYFVSFNDGTADWKGPSALDKILKKAVQSASLPRSVAFGSTFDTFFVVFNDGSWQYQGRGIPETLEEKLTSRGGRADLVTVNLGPSGEWFLKAENGRMWWSGITQELDGVLAKILKDGYLHSMDFGENGSYFVSYDED